MSSYGKTICDQNLLACTRVTTNVGTVLLLSTGSVLLLVVVFMLYTTVANTVGRFPAKP